MGSVNRYGQRMLNPYHGVVNVVEIDGADAVTRDGVKWMLYLQGKREEELLDDGTMDVFHTPDIKFGAWTSHGGLRRAPVRSVIDFEAVQARGMALLEAVRHSAPHGPFALADRFECWLLAADGHRPIALIDSACERPGDTLSLPAWRPGQASHHEFVSPRFTEATDCPLPTDLTHAARLARAVNRAAGDQPLAQWFARRADGSGAGVADAHLPAGLRARTLEAPCFPELMLTTEWWDDGIRKLAEDFLAWQAPWLLQLQHLCRDTRARLECAARRRARLTASLHHLYPAVVEERQIRAALVEARLTAADTQTAEPGDQSMATFYIEMCAFTVGN